MNYNLRLRQARVRDLVAICTFYQNNRSKYLPIVPLKQVSDSVEDFNFYIIEDKNNLEILATSAIFRISPNSAKEYIGEISGMQVSRAIGGTSPINIQSLLLGVRLIGHLISSGSNENGFSNSLITIVHRANAKSLSNVINSKFSELNDKPEWFGYEAKAFAGDGKETDWAYFYVEKETIHNCICLLHTSGFFSGSVNLKRNNKASGVLETFEIEIDLSMMNIVSALKESMINGEFDCDICHPPLKLTY